MKLSIRSKFLLLVSLLLLAIFGAITLFLIQSGTKSLRKNLFEESKAFAGLATQPIGNVYAIYKDSGTSRIDDQLKQFVELNSNIVNIIVVDIDGNTVYRQSDRTSPDVSQQDASSFEPVYKNDAGGALETIIHPYFEASGAHRFSVVYSVSDTEIETAVRNEALSLLYFGLLSLLITMALTYLLINRLIIKPVKQVSRQAGLISAGNLEQQIQIHGQDEIASLGDSVNRMAESLKANIAQLKEVDKVKSEFMMITSHNLRTPLTIIGGYLENMELFRDTEQLKQALTRMGASVKRLEIFAEDVLAISRFELGETTMDTSDVNVAEFLDELCKDFKPTAEMKNIALKTEILTDQATITASKPYIRSAVWNILDNAVKFNKENGQVNLKATIVGNQVEIAVTDTGIGISEAEIPKLFTKFHRGTSTLVYDFEGTGIGLYVSKMMVERNGGTISVQSREGAGSTFTIRLPLSTSIKNSENSNSG